MIPQLVLSTGGSPAIHRLVTFGDASSKMYSTVVYLHTTTSTEVRSQLILSKMRLTPTPKPKGATVMTIPRLELLGVLLGVRASAFAAQQLHLPLTDRLLYPDSVCVLHWLGRRKDLPRFVQNHVDEITKHQSTTTFYHVRSEDNPPIFRRED